MADRVPEFELYRLNVTNDRDLLSIMGRPISNNADILSIFQVATAADFDLEVERRNAVNVYKWSLREFVEYDNEGISNEAIAGVIFARSVVSQTGTIVTDTGVEIGTSTPDQPLGVPAHLILFMQRHAVAIEHKSAFMHGQSWKAFLHQILDAAATALGFKSSIRLEPISKDTEIMQSFNSFTKLTRIKVHLRLPNPDLSREMQVLYDAMENGGIKDFYQDMSNPDGLNKEVGQLPLAAASGSLAVAVAISGPGG